MSDTLTFVVEVLADVPPPSAPCPCESYGRVTTIYASAHVRDRVHVARCFSGEKRCLIVDFNAIAKGLAITSVTWEVDSRQGARLEQAVIDGMRAKVSLKAGQMGTMIRCTATLGDGCQHYVQMIRMDTQRGWTGDVPLVEGPASLTVTADP